MANKREPTTSAGRALAAWNRRSHAMAETVARIEAEAVDEWLASDDAQRQLDEALAGNVECTATGARYDVKIILAAMRQGASQPSPLSAPDEACSAGHDDPIDPVGQLGDEFPGG